MTEDRPFLEWPLEQLADHAQRHAPHPEILEPVLRELARRPGRAARDLARRIEAWRVAPKAAGPAPLLEEARREIARLKARLAALEGGGSHPTAHASLHLTPDAPRWLVLAVRHAYRRRFHPDAASPAEREAAEARFKEAERAFARILQSQGLEAE